MNLLKRVPFTSLAAAALFRPEAGAFTIHSSLHSRGSQPRIGVLRPGLSNDRCHRQSIQGPFGHGKLFFEPLRATESSEVDSSDEANVVTGLSETDDADVLPMHEALRRADLSSALSILRRKVQPAAGNSAEKYKISRSTWDLIFDAIEDATAQADDAPPLGGGSTSSSVVMPAISDASSPSKAALVRDQMTELYQLLSKQGHLQLFGAASRRENHALPVGGSSLLPVSLMEEILQMPLSALTPQQSQTTFLIAGMVLAFSEGLLSIQTGIPFTQIVVLTLLSSILDRILLNGAIQEGIIKVLKPETQKKIIRHEAGHFLVACKLLISDACAFVNALILTTQCADLLGCPVEGCVLSALGALKDRRFFRPGGGGGVTAGTSFYDPELSQQMNSQGRIPFTRSSIDRYSIIVMAGIAAEADFYQQADGGAGDEAALVALLSSLSRRGTSYVSGGTSWSPERIKNQARWGATQAVMLLRQYKPAYEALVDALERGGKLKDCIFAIEKSARENNLLPLSQPIGYIVTDDPKGSVDSAPRWTTTPPSAESPLPAAMDSLAPLGPGRASETFDPDRSKSTLEEYRVKMEERIRELDAELNALERGKRSN
jgi:hypothetical protein